MEECVPLQTRALANLDLKGNFAKMVCIVFILHMFSTMMGVGEGIYNISHFSWNWFQLGVNGALDCIASSCVFIGQYCNVLQYISSSNLIIYYNICHPMVMQCIVMWFDILHLDIT